MSGCQMSTTSNKMRVSSVRFQTSWSYESSSTNALPLVHGDAANGGINIILLWYSDTGCRLLYPRRYYWCFFQGKYLQHKIMKKFCRLMSCAWLIPFAFVLCVLLCAVVLIIRGEGAERGGGVENCLLGIAFFAFAYFGFVYCLLYLFFFALLILESPTLVSVSYTTLPLTSNVIAFT